MKEFSRQEIAMFKKVAALVEPYEKKNEKIRAKIAGLESELAMNNDVINRFENVVVEKTGYHVLDLFYHKETVTNRLDAKGNYVVDKSWQPKYPDTILPPDPTEGAMDVEDTPAEVVNPDNAEPVEGYDAEENTQGPVVEEDVPQTPFSYNEDAEMETDSEQNDNAVL